MTTVYPIGHRVFRTAGSDPAVTITPQGRVGIGTSADFNYYRLELPQTSIGGRGKAIAYYWDNASSRRWKQNVHPIDDALSIVERLCGVTYDWKPQYGGQHDIGFIAEEVGKIVPEVVTFEKNGQDALGMDYARLTALLVEAIKAQQKQIGTLKTQVTELERLQMENDGLKATLADVLKRLETLENAKK